MRVFCSLLVFSISLRYTGYASPANQQLSTPTEMPAAGVAGAADYDNGDDWFNNDGRIVGGWPASILNFPYQVSLQYKGQHICGGAIIRLNAILTAAHCVEHSTAMKAFKVRAGSSQYAHGGQLRTVQRIFRHESYSSVNYNHDVALLQLEQALIQSKTVQPVQLAPLNAVLRVQAQLFVSGWGLTSETGHVSAVLNYVDVHLIQQETCVQNYKYVVPITAEMFCAGYSIGGKDSCQGDSGGPLVAYYRGVATLYGIVSWGVGCAQKEYPGVYAKVSVLRPWIDEKLAEIDKASEYKL